MSKETVEKRVDLVAQIEQRVSGAGKLPLRVSAIVPLHCCVEQILQVSGGAHFSSLPWGRIGVRIFTPNVAARGAIVIE